MKFLAFKTDKHGYYYVPLKENNEEKDAERILKHVSAKHTIADHKIMTGDITKKWIGSASGKTDETGNRWYACIRTNSNLFCYINVNNEEDAKKTIDELQKKCKSSIVDTKIIRRDMTKYKWIGGN